MKCQAPQARVTTDPRYGSATITPHLLRYLTLVAAERGHDLGPALRRASLTEAALSAVGQRISYRQGSSVIREAIRDLDDPALGLAVGRRQRATAWGLVGFGLQASPTLHDALELGVRHHGVTGSMLDHRTQTVPGGAAILATARYADSELRAFLLEEAFASIVALVRDSLDETFAPHTVAVRHPRPPYGGAYEDYFRCPVVFDAPTTGSSSATTGCARRCPVPTPTPSPRSARSSTRPVRAAATARTWCRASRSRWPAACPMCRRSRSRRSPGV